MDPLPGLRAVTDADADALIALVAAAYAEYPGCVLDLPGVDADLAAPARVARDRGGPWWVVEDGGAVVASIGAAPGASAELTELKRLYVARSHRGNGLGARLVPLVEAHARERGSAGVELWSDTRFTAAHRLYERCGYEASGRTRRLHDPSHTTEYHFVRWLDGR